MGGARERFSHSTSTKEAAMTDTKACRDCGKPFKRSRADRTVRCPSCRRSYRHAGDQSSLTKATICCCGKTCIIDGFGTPTDNICPHCGDC